MNTEFPFIEVGFTLAPATVVRSRCTSLRAGYRRLLYTLPDVAPVLGLRDPKLTLNTRHTFRQLSSVE